MCSPEIISVFDETIISISSMTFGFPAFPTPIILPSFTPMSAFMIPSTGSIIIALVITKSAESFRNTPLA